MSRRPAPTAAAAPDPVPARVLHCSRVATGTQVLGPATLTIREGTIASVDAAAVAVDPGSGRVAEEVEHVDGWVLPGFVDTHCHGGGGFDYATTDPDEARAARHVHLSCGTTSTLASLVTADIGTLCAQLRALDPLVRTGHLAGVHLEGPFLSPAHRGAHDPSLLRDPTPQRLERLLDAADGTLTAMTIAPELPGALEAIPWLVEAGVRVAVGHTDTDEVTVRRALDAGATVATHLFNAMRPIHHRAPGPAPRLLTDPRVTAELIADGVHVHPDVLALAVRAAGPQRVALVTDAMAAAGQPDGRYRLGPLDVQVTRGGQARLVTPDGSPGALAGSTLTMASTVATAVGLGLPLPDVARMAAATPAVAYGLDDVGVLEAGRRADLCVLDAAGTLHRVMRGGEWISPHGRPPR